jgi:hypothetical protein
VEYEGLSELSGKEDPMAARAHLRTRDKVGLDSAGPPRTLLVAVVAHPPVILAVLHYGGGVDPAWVGWPAPLQGKFIAGGSPPRHDLRLRAALPVVGGEAKPAQAVSTTVA